LTLSYATPVQKIYSNSLRESIRIFHCMDTFFKKNFVFLFLAQFDVFAQKIQQVPLSAVKEFEDCKVKSFEYLV
jgi:hypothetical protein